MKSKLNLLAVLAVILIWSSTAFANGVHPLFDQSAPSRGPFPSDVFTVADPANNTGLRVNLPRPDCLARPSDCLDLDVINALDGFNVQPRLSIPFDGPIDVSTITRHSVLLVSLGDTLGAGDRGGRVIGINQIVWDPLTNTLYAESDELLDQHTRYALIVTNQLHDLGGSPIESTEAFLRFRQDVNFGQTHDSSLKGYRKALLDAFEAARAAGVPESVVVSATIFTTQSVTSGLEKIRDQLKASVPSPPDFFLAPGGNRTLFTVNELKSITFRQQTGDSPAAFTSATVPLSSLAQFMSGAVSKIAFGRYTSPDYEVHPGEFIPEIGTRTGVPVVQSQNQIYFNVFLPSGPKPAAGWPVAIFIHGGPGNKDNDPYLIAASLASQGIATIAINAVGRGFGPLGSLTVSRTVGDPLTFPSGGRGFDQNGNKKIAADEGAAATAPREIIGQRDALRQTTVDLMQLVRVVETGIDVDGDGSSDLDASHILYFGGSFGGGLGILLLAVEPNVRVGAFTVPGAAAGRIDLIRLRPATRGSVGTTLASRTPSLINPSGLTSIGGIAVAQPFFNENIPLRNQSPVINNVVGALAIQEVFENAEWASESGDAAAYAPYIRREPLPGVPAKSVLVQFAKGDQTGPNPRTTAILRAGDLADRATFFRNDLAFAEDGTVPRDPHLSWTRFTSQGITGQVARGIQVQFATFLATAGTDIIQPEPQRFFEAPVVLPLPESLDFVSNPNDDAGVFVRQQYLDFLSREPDQGGWDYWTNEIAQCGSDAACIHRKRIDVSGAFFVENEFQQTGYVVYRTYRAAFGTVANAPSRANVNFAQFMADRAQLVGGPGLQQSTINFASNFVQRPGFKQAYADSMSSADFVNNLFDTANLMPFTRERQDETSALVNGTKNRAQLLLDVIEMPQFKDREYNPAFVLMQYFGYLRRDPDQGGYDFWLNVLNNREPNNYRGMVCSFITSSEYQLRFGSVATRSNADCGQ